jgi:gamma-glutamylcyclotransferase (GGCT)/AIG2-like uncharacterized protein YtfP
VTAASELLFVYGSLMSGSGHPMAARLAASAEFVGHGRFRGCKYKVDWYCGVVPSEREEDVVTGEVYRLHDVNDLLSLLDDYEEAEPLLPAPAEFRREQRPVCITRDGSTTDCWIYLYTRPVAALAPLQ